jgi:hypothetical protein
MPKSRARWRCATPTAGRTGRRFRPTLSRLDERVVPALLSFQQGVNGYAGTQDTDLFSQTPNTNYGDVTFISPDQQDVNNVHHALLRFDNIFTNNPGAEPNKIPFGSQINSATLTLNCINESNQAALVSPFKMLVDWNEATATWNSLGPIGGIQTDDIEASRIPESTLGDTTTIGLKDLGVTRSVQSWALGAANYGWAIIQFSSNGWDFETSEAATNQPKLTVDFTPPSGAGLITFLQPTYSFVEGDAGTTVVNVPVARMAGLSGPASVDYKIEPITATPGSDYDNTVTSGTLNFTGTTNSLPINLGIVGDTLIEGTEKFKITLSGFTGAAAGTTLVTEVSIADDDLLINEVFANVSGLADDGYEFIELIGTPGAALTGFQVVIFEGETEEGGGGVGGAGGGVGVADFVVDLSPHKIGSNGLLVITPTNWKYSPSAGTTQVKVAALDKSGGGIEDSSLTVAILGNGPVLTVGTDYDLDVMPALPNNSLEVGLITPSDPLWGYDIVDSVGWTEMGGSDADRQITYAHPGVRLNQPAAQVPPDSGGTSSDAASRIPGDRLPNNIGSWFNGDITNPNVPVAYNRPPQAYVNIPEGAQLTPGELNTQRVISFVTSSYKVNETAGTVTLTVDRLGDVSSKTEVTYTTFDGTAKAGSDYKASTGLVEFNIGDKQASFTIDIFTDGVPEGFETFSVKLSNPTSPFLIANTTATVRIDDADAKVASFQDGDLPGEYSGTRDAGIYGWEPTTPFGFDFTIAVDQADANLITDPQRPTQAMIRFDDLFGNLPGQIPVGSTILNAFITFNVLSPTAPSANVRLYRNFNDWSELSANWATPTLNPAVTNGVAPDGVESGAVIDGFVTTPDAAGLVSVAVSVDTIQAWANGSAPNFGWTIVNDSDDDWTFASADAIGPANRPQLTVIFTPPAGDGVISFAEPNFQVNENDGTATLTVHRIGGNTNTLTVNVAITGGTADALDYGAPTASLVFGPTDKFKTITLPIVNDGKLEPNETVEFTLSGAGVTFTRDKATLLIRDDDFVTAGGKLVINELESNSIGQDKPYEYIEFAGPANQPTGGLYFLVVEGDFGSYTGTNEFAHDMGRLSTGANGLILITAPPIGGVQQGHATPDPLTTLDYSELLSAAFQNPLRSFTSETSSFVLIYSPAADLFQFWDYDWDNDGVLDLPAGAVVIDAISQNDLGGGDKTYGPELPLPQTGGQVLFVPDQISRFRGNTNPLDPTAYFFGDHLGTDDALVYNPALSVGLPISGAAASPGQINVDGTTPLVSLTSVKIDNGGIQRSNVRSITLSFNGVADRLLTDGITLTNQGGGSVPGVSLKVAGINSNTWTITFEGSPVAANGGSLPDGLYRLTIDGIDIIAAGRTTDANNAGAVNTVRTVDFHRLFGDQDGDRDVDAIDFGAFRNAFGQPGSVFDSDGDGDVDATDFGAFRARFGSSI